MARIVDLTLPMDEHWRWPFHSRVKHTLEAGDTARITALDLDTHCFTHIDSPAHVIAGAPTLDQYGFDKLIGPASVVNLTDVSPDMAISADFLKVRAGHVQAGDIVLLRTDWQRQESYQTEMFWDHAPYLTVEAAEFLAARKVSIVGYDFPQDYAIRLMSKRPVACEELVVHHVFLPREILQLEYVTNLWDLSRDRVTAYIMPMKLKGTDGAPVRAIAVED